MTDYVKVANLSPLEEKLRLQKDMHELRRIIIKATKRIEFERRLEEFMRKKEQSA